MNAVSGAREESRRRGVTNIIAGLLAVAVMLGCCYSLARNRQHVDDTPGGGRQALSVTGLQGEPVDLGKYRGRVVLLDVWATWCSPCIKAFPRLQALHDKFEAKGFTVVGVSVEVVETEKVASFVKSRGITFPVFIDSIGTQSIHSTHDVQTIPALFLIDRSGKIVRRWTGEAEPDDVEAAVIAALAEGD